jgi:hypothetical protein
MDHIDRWRGRYNESLFKLFVSKFGMDVDVIDASPRMLDLLSDNFRELSEIILSHQSVKLANWPIQQRFQMALRLESCTPLNFQRTVGLSISNELAQLSDAHIGTALHWAAKEWCGFLDSRNKAEPSTMTDHDAHEEFITALLENGALLHALDKYGRTPLTCMIDCRYYYEAEQLWVPYSGHGGGAVLADLWGRLLSGAGVSLPEYVAQENALLTARSGQDEIYPEGNGGVRLSRFVLSEQQKLQLEVTAVGWVEIWEFRPPPGLFIDSSDFSTIFWSPDTNDGNRTCWQYISTRELRSKPFGWTKNPERQLGETIRRAISNNLFRGTNDDHSALALLLRRDQQRRTQGTTRRPRRSSSMPPLGNAYLYDETRYGFALLNSEFRLPDEGLVTPRVHKCLFDSQWGFVVPNDYDEHSWRGCMKGCQGRKDYSSLFEEFLRYTASQAKRSARELERLGRIVEID